MRKQLFTAFFTMVCLGMHAQYTQTFETVSLQTLISDSGWSASGVTVGNSNKLTGAKELITQVLNQNTASQTYLNTYYYRGQGTNVIEFQHVINNASGADIELTVYAIDTFNVKIDSFNFVYSNASAVNSTWYVYSTGPYRLNFNWDGAKVKSGSTAGLDMLVMSSPMIALPVKLMDFKATSDANGTTLKWTSAEESQLNGYELYRSLDGINFNAFGIVEATGHETTLNQYEFLDIQHTALSGLAYYKIRMLNTDGSFTWSKMLSVNPYQINLPVQLYPQPAAGFMVVQTSSEYLPSNTAFVEDLTGRRIQMVQVVQGSEQNRLLVNTSELRSGIYFLDCSMNKGRSSALNL